MAFRSFRTMGLVQSQPASCLDPGTKEETNPASRGKGES